MIQKKNTWRRLILDRKQAKLCASNLSNPFWIDVLNSWKAFLKCNPTSQIEDVLNSPIWFNSEMQHGEKFFIKNSYEKGIRNIVGLINENRVFYDFNQFKTLFNVRGTINFRFLRSNK